MAAIKPPTGRASGEEVNNNCIRLVVLEPGF